MKARKHSARGVSLLEALVAVAVMAFGMLGVVGMQTTLRSNADVAKQRAEAVRIAQAKVEDWRAFEKLNAGGAVPDFTVDIVNEAGTTVTTPSNTTYTRSASVLPTTLATADRRLKTFIVSVTWADRNGQAQGVSLTSSIAGIAPELGGAFGLAADRSPTQKPGGRQPGVPPGSVDQGNGTSTFAPPGAAAGVTWVFNNLSGLITSLCNPYPATCVATNALPLSGFIDFSTGATQPTAADAENPSSPAFAVGVAISPLTAPATPAFTPVCYTSAVVGNFLAYFCAVPLTTTPPPQWTGKSILTGLALATGPADSSAGSYRVCRYTPTTPATPQVNAEHPATYASVTKPLVNQNFLVIRAGDGAGTVFICPPDGPAPGDSNTVLHQP